MLQSLLLMNNIKTFTIKLCTGFLFYFILENHNSSILLGLADTDLETKVKFKVKFSKLLFLLVKKNKLFLTAS